jgi:hypothetical protein
MWPRKYFFFYSIGVWTQGLTLARQTVYNLIHTPSLFFFSFFSLVGSPDLAQTVLKTRCNGWLTANEPKPAVYTELRLFQRVYHSFGMELLCSALLGRLVLCRSAEEAWQPLLDALPNDLISHTVVQPVHLRASVLCIGFWLLMYIDVSNVLDLL